MVEPRHPPLQHGLILVVDDDRMQQALTSRVLGKFGFDALCAASGAEAIRLAETRHPELILLDVDMPDMDGFTVCQRLKESHATRAIPVIFVTGMDDPLDRLKGFTVGASDYIAKPIHAGELNARVTTHVTLRRQIRDLSALEDALRHSEMRYRLLVEKTPDIFWEASGDGELVYVSPQYEKVMGKPAHSLVGHPIGALFPDSQGEPAHISFSGDRNELATRHADGSLRIIELSISDNPDEGNLAQHRFGVARDITERRLSERRIEQLSLAVQSSPVAVAISDYDGLIESVNPAFCSMTGYAQTEIIGRPVRILRSGVHPQSFFDALWERLHAGENCTREFCNRRKDGSIYWVRQVISPIVNSEGRLTHFVWVGEDFTLAREKEQALREAKEAAEKATQAKSDFLANMSHEIRTPMNAIIGMSHLCLQTRLEPKQHTYLTNISTAAQSLLGIINDILDFSKIEAGRLQLERIAFDLTAVFGHVANLSTPRAREKGLALHFRIAPEVPVHLLGDPTRLGQVLLNLVSNAVKFTEQGNITVQVSLQEMQGDAAHLHFAVTDQGIGMTEAQCASLFRPFVQADTSTTRKYGGTGLGLTICKQIVEAMGGRISLTSTPGTGTTFDIHVPLGIPELATQNGQDNDEGLNSPIQASTAAPLSEDELGRLAGLRVLLVEDNAFNQQVATDLLALAGIVSDVAEDGQQALDRLHAQSYDLVLMDLQMPVMDGFTATREIRKNPVWAGLPILAMTANAMVGDRDRCLAAGMNAHIAKPIDPNTLYRELLRWRTSPSVTPAATRTATTPPEPPSAASEDQTPDLPGFDVDAAIARMRGNVNHYRRMLAMFVKEFAAYDQRIGTEIEAGNLSTAKRLAHTLKGSAGTIGATELQRAAIQMDKLLERQRAAEAAAALPGLSDSLKAAVAAIQALPAS